MTTSDPRISPSAIIWEAIVGLAESGQVITRQRLKDQTGLKFTQVDEYVSKLVDVEGRLRRLVNGVYELVDTEPEPRPVSFTDLSDGTLIIECGDQEMRVRGKEIRDIGVRLYGNALQYRDTQIKDDVGAMLIEVTLRNRELANQLSDLKREMSFISGIPELRQLIACAKEERKAQAAGQLSMLEK